MDKIILYKKQFGRKIYFAPKKNIKYLFAINCANIQIETASNFYKYSIWQYLYHILSYLPLKHYFRIQTAIGSCLIRKGFDNFLCDMFTY